MKMDWIWCYWIRFKNCSFLDELCCNVVFMCCFWCSDV